MVKGATYSFAKWAWVRDAGDGLLILRASLGRFGEEATLQVLSGTIRLTAGDDVWEGTSGDHLVIPPHRHDLAHRRAPLPLGGPHRPVRHAAHSAPPRADPAL